MHTITFHRGPCPLAARIRFNLRHVAASLVILGLVLAILRRPLRMAVELTAKGGPDSELFWQWFLTPMMHVGWLAGYDVVYPDAQGPSWTLMPLVLGSAASVLLHLLAGLAAYYVVAGLWRWARG